MIDIIAPAGKIKDPAGLPLLEKVLHSWGYKTRFGRNILDNTKRFDDLKTALYAEDSNIIWCYRGGSGASELLPKLSTLKKPSKSKIFLGFSDITSLHLFFIQQWGWTVYHGPGARQIAENLVDEESIRRVKLLFETQKTLSLSNITGPITGGNLSIISHSFGTPYQIIAKNKHLLLEDTNEPAYKIQRMLTQLDQAGIFNEIKSLILGEFTHKDEHEKELIQKTVAEFIRTLTVPVHAAPIGHGKTNYTVPLQ